MLNDTINYLSIDSHEEFNDKDKNNLLEGNQFECNDIFARTYRKHTNPPCCNVLYYYCFSFFLKLFILYSYPIKYFVIILCIHP